ncbi:hypothetical protein TNCV_3412681 [Trichonephila clavipes]|uniref:Uncharacterized protein n=1 Tax=Trichonephila clavipes TaxID=2585209 RepID=A0A8X6RFX1_TRICX|nr:hypothetical protein TNCV_3412681 [Trichonephila clavipes]
MAVLDALSQLRSRKEPGSLVAYQWWEGGIFHSLDSCLLILDWCSLGWQERRLLRDYSPLWLMLISKDVNMGWYPENQLMLLK